MVGRAERPKRNATTCSRHRRTLKHDFCAEWVVRVYVGVHRVFCVFSLGTVSFLMYVFFVDVVGFPNIYDDLDLLKLMLLFLCLAFCEALGVIDLTESR
ncbi:hypothetical protein C8Q78DRAFT_1058055 [Trametes maxima]|nr:hypothetical protein C8Q78DRAFT_1058055 [Trametes maxima]